MRLGMLVTSVQNQGWCLFHVRDSSIMLELVRIACLWERIGILIYVRDVFASFVG